MNNTDVTLARYIVDAISDDFEDFDMVVFEVSRWAACDGLILQQEEIWTALHRLLRTGEARAFWMCRDGRMVELENIPESSIKGAYYISKAKAAARDL